MGVLTFGSSTIASVAGPAVELVASKIDNETHPVLRSVIETGSKAAQVAAAGFTLIFADLVFHVEALAPVIRFLYPILGGTALTGVLSGTFLLTPVVIRLLQNSENKSLNAMARIADQIVNISAKVINTMAAAIIGASISGTMMVAIPLAIGTGLLVGGLNYMAYANSRPDSDSPQAIRVRV